MSIIRKIQSHVPDCTYHVDVGIGYLKENLEQYKVDTNPIYQRDYVWTEEQKHKFVGSVIENPKSIPPFWFNWISKDFHRSHCEVIDGKQRLNAINEWLDGKFTALCPCNQKVHINDLDEIDLRNIKMSTTINWNFVELNQIEVMKFYIRLNSGGTIHTEKELEKVKKLIETIKEN